MAEPYVRLLAEEEIPTATRIVSEGMLGSLSDEVVDAWSSVWEPEECHGAFTQDDRLVGVVRWFRDEVSLPGRAVPAGGVTAVAVASPHRRHGHLTRLIHTQLAPLVGAGVAISTPVAAEWPLPGRFGSGPARAAR